MKITAVRTFMAMAATRPRVLVKVETDEGIHGWGEAYSVGPEPGVQQTIEYIAPWFLGEDPRRIEYLMMKTHQQFRFPPGGTGLAAVSGIEHALWDISGKAAGLPVYLLLGGHVRDRVRVYQSIGSKIAELTAESAQRLHERWGLTAFKLKPYQKDPESSRWGEVCKAAAAYFEDLRSRTPDNWEFAFDAHAQIFEPIRALQLAQALTPFDPFFYEEPLRPEHAPAWARLRQQMPIPLATGECLYTRFEFLDILAAQAADIIQPDICICGGLLEMRKIADIAAAHYVTVAPHNPMGPIATAVNVHFAASIHNFKILEFVNPSGTVMETWVDEPYLPKNGYLELRDRPGLGIEVDEAAITALPYAPWQRTAPLRPDGATGYI